MEEKTSFNVEIKAKCDDLDEIRTILKNNYAKFIGTDHQKDTYFKVKEGRLKLREGNIENSLIYYDRANESGPKKSDVILYKTRKDPNLYKVLCKVSEILIIVDKVREIYFIGNVKIHLDSVKDIGTYVEIEAIKSEENNTSEKLEAQCNRFIKTLKIKSENLISDSYSDMLLKIKN